MHRTGVIEDIDCGDFFDNIDDYLDFPNEDVEGGFSGDCDGAFPSVRPPLSDPLGPPPNMLFSGNDITNKPSELATEFPVPYEDLAQMEWLSDFVEDSFSSGSITMEKDLTPEENKESHQFQTSSPMSVLESSSSSCSGGKTMSLSPETIVPGRARSKRPRPATFNPRPMIPLVSPASSSITESAQPFSASEESVNFDSFAESHHDSYPLKKSSASKIVATEQKKKKKKLSLPLGTMDMDRYPLPLPISVRKCLHCEITKTPQWRAGPMGPKTLCNACGVRFKSGRLFPEYRPAASPTFVAALHSNSHKKVVEMRNKVDQKTEVAVTTDLPELVPNPCHMLNYI